MGDHLVGMTLRKNGKLKIALPHKPLCWTGFSGFNGELKFSMLDHQTERMAPADVLSMFSDKLLEKNSTLTFERDLGKLPLKGNLLMAEALR